jgi:hypothetical protein
MTSPASARSLGRHDEAFRSEGAIAYQRDIPAAEVHLLDTGHFALETHAAEIAALSLPLSGTSCRSIARSKPYRDRADGRKQLGGIAST